MFDLEGLQGLQGQENIVNQLKAHSNKSTRLNTDTKNILGYSNLGEAYTNLYEGMSLRESVASAHRSAETAKQESQNANAHAQSANASKDSAEYNANLSKNAKKKSQHQATNAANQARKAKDNAKKTCENKNISNKESHEVELNLIKSEYDRKLNSLNQQKTEILNRKSETYSEASRKQLNKHSDNLTNDGITAITQPEDYINSIQNKAEQHDITNEAQLIINALEQEYAELLSEEIRLNNEKENAINNLKQPIYEECYSNIEGFKEGLSFTVTPATGQENDNYGKFKNSVHNLIDNKIVEKAVQEKNFKNDLVLSYLSDNDYSKTDLKKIYDSEEQKNNLNKRKNNILKYENNVFKQYIHILKVIVIVLLLIAPILILNKKEIINYTITKYLIIILFVLVFMYIIKILYDINSRDSINFNKYKLDDGKYRRLHEQGKISRKGRLSSMLGGTCIGSQCCDEGMTYDANSDKCIYTEISAELKIISSIDSNTYYFTINSNKSGKLSVNNNGLSETEISVGDNTLQMDSYVSTTTYTATFTPDDGTDIVTIIIP